MSEYNYKKWNELLNELDKHVKLDLDYQTTKAHDQTCCEASQRLGGVLAKYMSLYNDGITCIHQNLQVQKAIFIENIINAVAARMLELLNQLRRLEDRKYQFLGNSLIQNLLTYSDTEPKDVLRKLKRSERLRAVIDEVMMRANTEKEATIHKESTEMNTLIVENKQVNIWVSGDESEDELNVTSEVRKELSEESLKRIEMIKLIQAHERSRQVTRWATQRTLKRALWEKELSGTLKPQASFEVKERAASLIQNVIREYFAIKRRRIDDCKVDELLGINFCGKPITTDKTEEKQIIQEQLEKKKEYVINWKTNCEKMETQYAKKVQDDLAEEYRDVIRTWFRKWYEEVTFFYNIPTEEEGGSALIIKDDVPTPLEWQAQYEAYLEEKKANKNKTSHQKKWEKLEAKKEEMRLKREERRKKKHEEALMKKLMKNPKMHPGFHYPASKNTKQIINVIANYREHWKDIDFWKVEGYKEGFVKEIDKNNACMNTKITVMNSVDESMRQELSILKKALQIDYKNNNEKMPKMMKSKTKRPKRRRKLKSTISENIQEKLEALAVAGVLKEPTEMSFGKFLGEFNYVGDDLRCGLQDALPLEGEIKSLWWEKCNELFHGAQRFMLIGPQGCGKTLLVHLLASINHAVLFELDPTTFPSYLKTPRGLRQTVSSVLICARAVQPSVIHLKCLQLLYCKKAPLGENKKHLDVLKHYFVQTLLKKIHKNDLITVIGSCSDPWLTVTNKLLQKFPDVIMLPDTTYQTVSMILRNWMAENRMVPRGLNLQSIAQVLRGYPIGHLKESLKNFLTPENIVKIAACGLSPQDILEHVTRGGDVEKVDYKKYQQWYTENTAWGKREEKRINDDKEFKLLAIKYAEKERKKKKKKEKNEEDSEDSYSTI